MEYSVTVHFPNHEAKNKWVQKTKVCSKHIINKTSTSVELSYRRERLRTRKVPNHYTNFNSFNSGYHKNGKNRYLRKQRYLHRDRHSSYPITRLSDLKKR